MSFSAECVPALVESSNHSVTASASCEKNIVNIPQHFKHGKNRRIQRLMVHMMCYLFSSRRAFSGRMGTLPEGSKAA